MAEAKHKALYIDLTGGGVAAGDPDDPRVQEATSELQSFLDEYSGGSHKISLFKVKKGSADLEWLEHYAPGSLSPELIRDEWGPGSYSLTLLDAAGHFIRRRKFHIGGKPEDWDRARGIDRDRHGKNGDGQELQIEMMRQQHELTLAMINNRGGGLEDTIKAFVALKENSSNPGEQLQFMTQMITLAKQLGAGNDNSVAGLIREIAPAVLEQIPGVVAASATAAAPRARVNGAEAPALPAPKEIAAPAVTDVATGTGEGAPPDPDRDARAAPASPAAPTPDQTQLVLARLAYWKGKARLGHKADFWIDYVFENPDEPDIQAVLWAVRNYEFGTIIGLDPEIGADAELRRFFLNLYDGIKAELLNADDSGGAGGDAPNAPSDAGVDPGGDARAGDPRNGDRTVEEAEAEQPA